MGVGNLTPKQNLLFLSLAHDPKMWKGKSKIPTQPQADKMRPVALDEVSKTVAWWRYVPAAHSLRQPAVPQQRQVRDRLY